MTTRYERDPADYRYFELLEAAREKAVRSGVPADDLMLVNVAAAGYLACRVEQLERQLEEMKR